MKKVLFVNDEMVVGGVSRVLINLLQQFDYMRYEVSLLVLHPHGEMLKDIPSSVHIIYGTSFFEVVDLGLRELISQREWKLIAKKVQFIYLMKTGKIIKKIKKERDKFLKEKFDIEIAFKEGFCSVFVASGDAEKKINWIHVDYKVMNYAKNYMKLMKGILNDFDYHIAVSKVAGNSFKEVFNIEKSIHVIHNVIQSNAIIAKANEEISFRDQMFSIVSVGRLHPQKSYDRLIKVCNRLIKEGYIFKTYIIGGGELENSLRSLINELKVEEFICLLGNKENPFSYLKQADLFVLSSLYEGLPTVVYEALILGIPVLSVEVSGIDEQIIDDIGLIVENDEKGLYEGLKRILSNVDILNTYKENLKLYNYNNAEIYNSLYNLLG